MEATDPIWKHILDLFKEGEINLNLGCGESKIEEAINCDLYNENADRKIDVRDLSEFDNGSVNAIYASELIEHFGKEEVKKVLREWHRVLRIGGYLILSLPNMERIIEVLYEWDRANWVGERPPNLWESMMKMIYGWQTNEGDFHKWGYSPDELTKMLGGFGFEIEDIHLNYPQRWTPNFMVIARKENNSG